MKPIFTLLLVLALVLGVAGSAGAVLQISVAGDLNPADLEYSLSPGSQLLTLGIWTSDPISGNGGYFALLVLNSQGTITGGYSAIIPTPLEPWPTGPEEMNGVYGTTVSPEPIEAGTVIFDGISFGCNSPEDAVIQLYALNEDFTLGPLLDQVVINQETITTPSVAKTTAAPAIAGRVNGGRVETFVASGAVSSDGHALEYKFSWGDGQVSSWGSATRTHTYTYTAAATYNVMVQARCIAHPTIVSAVSPTLVETSECVQSTATFYTSWATTFSRPNCWCCRRNCRGDVDCLCTGIGPNRICVDRRDLIIFAAAYNQTQTVLMTCNVSGVPCICADNNRIYSGIGNNRLWVNSTDLLVFASYFNIPEASVPICPQTNYWYWTN